jgi:pimeloyl-ACP methyl ester carboxylesterase
MAKVYVHGVNLYYERTGDGEPLVFVHGSWGDHHNWDGVVPHFRTSYNVTTYDRRGHSQSEAGPGQGSFDEDAHDLEALLEQLGLAPAHVIGNSGGASIALKLAARRPKLFRSLVVHEPPLLDLLKAKPEFEPVMAGFNDRIQPVVALLEAGQMDAAAERFVDTVAFGTGAWAGLPQPVRETFVHNAPTFLDECRDVNGLNLDLEGISRFDKPALLTAGTASPPFFKPIVDLVAEALPLGQRYIFQGAGHVPHLSYAQQYATLVGRFCADRTVSGPETL